MKASLTHWPAPGFGLARPDGSVSHISLCPPRTPLFKRALQPGALLDHIIELIDDYSPGDGLVFKKTLIPLYWSFQRTNTSRTVTRAASQKEAGDYQSMEGWSKRLPDLLGGSRHNPNPGFRSSKHFALFVRDFFQATLSARTINLLGAEPMK